MHDHDLKPAPKRASQQIQQRGAIRRQGDQARDQHDWPAAVELYRAHLARRPGDFAAWVQLGHALKEAGRQVDALAAYSEALSLRPHDADLLLNLGHLHKVMGFKAEALTYYRQSAALGDARAADELRASGEAVVTPAAAPQAGGGPSPLGIDRWARRLRAVLERDVRQARKQGDTARDSRDWAAAARHYRRYLDQRPQDFAIWVQLGHALKETDRLAEAEACYQRSISIRADIADTHVQLGHALKLQGHLAPALAAYSEAAKLDPASWPIQAEIQSVTRLIPAEPRPQATPPSPPPSPSNEGASLSSDAASLLASQAIIDRLVADCAAAWTRCGELAAQLSSVSAGSVRIGGSDEAPIRRASIVTTALNAPIWNAYAARTDRADDLIIDVAVHGHSLTAGDVDRAVRAAAGDFVVVSTAPCIPGPSMLAAFARLFDRFPLAICAAAVVEGADGRVLSAGPVTDDAPALTKDDYRVLSATRCDLPAPGLFAVAKDVYLETAGFDLRQDSLAHALEDLCASALADGFEVRLAPGAGAIAVSQLDWEGRRSDAVRPVSPPKRRPRILVVDHLTPTPDKDAGSVDVFWGMRIFLRLGYDVTFVPAYDINHAGEYTDALRDSGIYCPVGAELGSPDQFIIKNGAQFDAIILYRVVVAYRLVDLCRHHAPNAKLLFHTQDLHFLREQRQAEISGDEAQRRQAEGTRHEELRCIRSSDATIVVSEAELALLAELTPQARCYCIPGAMRPAPGRLAPMDGRSGVMFVGGFSHAPNVDAVTFLCEEVWPLVRMKAPHIKLAIIGSNAPDTVRRYHDPARGIDVVGFVKDLSPYYQAMRANVAPLRYGAGIKGKIVAAMMVGIPSIATSAAAEGMGLQDGEHVLISDTAGGLADAIVRLDRDDDLWTRLSDTGMELAQRRFTVDSHIPQVAQILEDLGLPR